MKIAVGADHAGFILKEQVRRHLEKAGHEVKDFGTDSTEPVDYPDFAGHVAEVVAHGEAERGILFCGTGLGMAMAANRYPRVRAAPCTTEHAAEMARRHNDANVLGLGGRLVAGEDALRIVDTFLECPFEGGRHERRVAKMDSLSAARLSSGAPGPSKGEEDR